jgi:hypothetical protein
MEITTMIGCPLMCSFCPQSSLKAAYGKEAVKYMSMETFETCLSKLPKTVQLDFAGMSEPWANPACTKMLQLTLERGYRTSIYTTLYGISISDAQFITTELLPKYAAQLEIVVLHLPDANGNMRGYKGSEEYRTVLQMFGSTHSFLGHRLAAMTMDRTGRVHPTLQDIVPRLAAWQGHSRAGSLGEEQTKKVGASATPRKETRVKCGQTDYYDHNTLNPDGSVYLCCMDYGLSTKLGNLLEQDYWSLFESPVLTKLRIENQKPGFSKCSICKSCDCSVAA